MKTQKFVTPLLIAITTYLFSLHAFAADTATMQDVKQEMKQAASTIKNYSVAQRDEAVKIAKDTLNKLDVEIDRMENKLDNNSEKMSQMVRKKTRSTLQTLRRQRNEVAEWYGSMKHSSSDAWQEVKTGFLKSYNTLQEYFSRAENEY